MADLSITAGSVLPNSNTHIERGTAGDTITAGQVVYRSAADGRYELADADSATAAVRVPRGIALNSASDGQPLAIARSGDVTVNAVLTAGTAYYLSATAGGIAPLADLTAGDDVVLLGLAKSSSIIALDIQTSGVTL